jgi:hypothetical protein
MAKQAISGGSTTKSPAKAPAKAPVSSGPTAAQIASLASSVAPVTAQEKATVATLKDTSDVTAAKSAVAQAATDAAAVAKLTGGTVVNGQAVMPTNYQTGPVPATPVIPVPPIPPITPVPSPAEIAAKMAADQAAANKAISDKNALALLTSTLQGYGIDSPDGSISNAILGLIQSNYDAATIQALIESPTASSSSDPNVKALAGAWNARFSGNVAREKAGLTPLSPADYISTENSYKAVMARAGLDAAHMDPTKLGALIGADVSPAEVNQRVNAAMAAVTAEDPFVKQQLNQQFGLTNGDLVGHLLDPVTQASVIANKVTAAQIGAEASRAGVDVNAANAYALAAQGVTQAQAQQGFQSIAQQLPGTQELASRYQGYGTPQSVGAALQTATFGAPGTQTQAQAEQQLQRLKTQEVSAFSGSSGAGKGSLGLTDTSGLT